MQRTIYFDYLRVIACFAVIMLHVAVMEVPNYTEPSFEWNVMNVYNSLTRFCVPIFLMISGALFLNPERRISLRRLYTHNILRVITSFCFWSLVYAIYTYNSSEGPSFLTLFLFGHFHMWFLWLIVGLYVLIPLLRPIVQNKQALEYFFITSFVFSYVIPFFFELTKIFLPALNSVVEIGEIYCDKLELQILSGYTFYFILGYYLHIKTIKRKIENILILLGVFAGICIASLTCYVFHSTGDLYNGFYNYETLFVMLETIAVFMFVKRLCNVESTIVSSISKLSFGIYLVHMIVYYMLGITSTFINPLVGIPLVSLSVFGVSYAIIWLLSFIPLVNKWII